MRILFIALCLVLGGCAGITAKIPSFWDDNQSAKIIDARLSVERLDCDREGVSARVSALRDQLLWFELYSESKGLRQTDVIELVHPMRETVEDMHRRYSQAQASKSYCEIKQRILRSQAQKASEAILGRF